MSIRAVERRYGKIKQTERSEIKSREFATFTNAPARMSFRVDVADGEARLYLPGSAGARGSAHASTHRRGARLSNISIRR